VSVPLWSRSLANSLAPLQTRPQETARQPTLPAKTKHEVRRFKEYRAAVHTFPFPVNFLPAATLRADWTALFKVILIKPLTTHPCQKRLRKRKFLVAFVRRLDSRVSYKISTYRSVGPIQCFRYLQRIRLRSVQVLHSQIFHVNLARDGGRQRLSVVRFKLNKLELL
jgi:hypothetical protein